jgi:hypothetical protein
MLLLVNHEDHKVHRRPPPTVVQVLSHIGWDDGKCSLPVARIAERANIGRAKARAAIRLAEGLGLIAIEETPDRKRVIVNRGASLTMSPSGL